MTHKRRDMGVGGDLKEGRWALRGQELGLGGGGNGEIRLGGEEINGAAPYPREGDTKGGDGDGGELKEGRWGQWDWGEESMGQPHQLGGGAGSRGCQWGSPRSPGGGHKGGEMGAMGLGGINGAAPYVWGGAAGVRGGQWGSP